jgi:hypothetical protein
MCHFTYKPLRDINDLVKSNGKMLNRCCYADYLCHKHGVGLINRSKPEEFLLQSDGQSACIDRGRLVKAVSKANSQRTIKINQGKYRKIAFRRHLVGKVMASLYYRWLIHLAMVQGGDVKLSKNMFLATCIQFFMDWLKGNRTAPVSLYYRRTFQGL